MAAKKTTKKKVTSKAKNGREYELVVVIAGEATAAKKKQVEATVIKIVKAQGGKAGKAEDWGSRDLAYDINGELTGSFLIFDLEFDGGEASELNSKLRFESDIARFLLISK